MRTLAAPAMLRRGSRRGSVYVVVVAGLALLGLMTLTLSYTAQMEEQASRNWSEGIQARIGAITGAPGFDSAMGTSLGSLGPESAGSSLDPRAPKLFGAFAPEGDNGSWTGRSVARLASAASRLGFGSSDSGSPKGTDMAEAKKLLAPNQTADFDDSALLKSDVAYHRVEDESARFNLNALLDVEFDLTGSEIDFMNANAEATLPNPIAAPSARQAGAFIDDILRTRGIASALSGEELVRALVAHRYGQDGQPGVSETDDNLNGADADLTAMVADAGMNDLRMAIRSPLAIPLNTDGRDNDRDGQIDESDESIESDGLDNDHDGRIDEAGEGIDEPAEFRTDIRLRPLGDDRPFSRVDNLLQVPGFTPEIVEALRPYVTVFSVSRSGSNLSEGEGAGLGLISLDPNTATPEEIFSLLRTQYPDQPEELIGQYVANLVDRRDQDNVPSELTLGNLGETYTGIEVTPYLNEVAPDVATFTEDGDDGQFVEIFNPYTQDFDLTGWRIETGTSTVYLRGTLTGGSYLVLTDDYDDSNDPEPEEEAGFGSLYDVFGVVAVTLNDRVQEQETFDLHDQQGIVKLYDNQDNLVDSFAYTDGQFNGANMSFQRIDPRVRHQVHALATPLNDNAGYTPATFDEEAGLALYEALHNGPFRSPVEMMLVSTSYAPAGETVTTLEWRFPSIHADVEGNLDIRVIDLFQPGSPAPLRIPASEASAWAEGNLPEGSDGVLAQLLSVVQRPAAFHGRINVNTAPAGVLAVLPGVGEDLALRIADLREEPLRLGNDFPTIDLTPENDESETSSESSETTPEDTPLPPADGIYGEVPVLDEYGFAVLGFGARRALSPVTTIPERGQIRGESWFASRSPQASRRWTTLSDFIRDRELWGEASLVERLERTYALSAMVTFESLAYRVRTANIPNADAEQSPSRRASVMFTERILAADRQAIETVVFLYGYRVANGR